MNFVGTGKRLELEDFLAAAVLLNVDVAAVRAVVEIESAGRGFGPDKRPIILFEPHVFYRRLKHLPEAKRLAEKLGVAYPAWGTKPYPRAQVNRYTQLETALTIHPRIPLESTSWGLPQIMGFNYASAGYLSVHDLVEGMKESEGEQLMAMCRFIKTNRLDIAMRTKNWTTFASGYNGPSYIKNNYAVKLSNAYEKYAKEAPNV